MATNTVSETAEGLSLRQSRPRYGEKIIRSILALAAFVSIFTTFGIVVSLLIPSIEFFLEVPITDFPLRYRLDATVQKWRIRGYPTTQRHHCHHIDCDRRRHSTWPRRINLPIRIRIRPGAQKYLSQPSKFSRAYPRLCLVSLPLNSSPKPS